MVERIVRPLWVATALVLLAGCANQKEKADVEVDALVAMLPGSYDNLAQSRAAGNEHPALRLMVAPVQAPLVGDHVFYVQEFAADDARRVLAQRLYVVESPADGQKPIMAQLDFTEPNRWRDGHLNRDLFRGLMPQDLRPRAGCGMTWTRSTTGFTAENDPKSCRVSSRTTGEALKAEQRIELTGDGLALLDQHRDAAGTLMVGTEKDPWYRFSRRADAPW